MTNASASPLSQYYYETYGRKVSSIDFVPSSQQYAGYYFHPRSQLNLVLARIYNASLGRWITRDPLEEEDNTNRYNFSDNDPINLFDLTGLETRGRKKSGKGKKKNPICQTKAPPPPKYEPSMCNGPYGPPPSPPPIPEEKMGPPNPRKDPRVPPPRPLPPAGPPILQVECPNCGPGSLGDRRFGPPSPIQVGPDPFNEPESFPYSGPEYNEPQHDPNPRNCK